MAGAASVNVAVRRGCIALLFPVLLMTGCLTPARPPLTVWAVDADEWLTPESTPAPESDVFSTAQRQVSVTAAINETAAFQLALRTETPPLGPFQIEVTDLAGPGGTLAAADVSLFRIQSVRVTRFRSWYPEHTGRAATPASFPDVLVPWNAPQGGGPVLLDGAENELVWVDVRIPPTTDPGTYTGRLIVRKAGETKRTPFGGGPAAPALTLGLRVQVLPVALPSERTLPVICRIDPRDLLAAQLAWPREAAEQTRLLPGEARHQGALTLVGNTMKLFEEHRTTPVLWASFPKYRAVGPREVELDWEPYDRLVESWLSGQAFGDLVGLTHWPVPVSVDYPDARQEGGLASPGYARLLSAYLAECRRHFAERGWLDRAFVRLCPPEDLTADAVERVRRAGAVMRQSESGLPLVAHLPARSLRGLGWQNAPDIELPDVQIWAPRAMWYEPQAMNAEQTLGRGAWLCPDQPPYSGSLAVESLPTDAGSLGWLAYRYETNALWVEHAAEFGELGERGPGARTAAADCLIYPGKPYGLEDRPVPSIRLKRLRRGLQDHALLTLLDRRGKQLLARSLAEQVVRWGCTDACIDNLLHCKPAGWPGEGRLLTLARELALQELVGKAGAGGVQVARLAEWGVLMNEGTRLRTAVEGVRVSATGEQTRARAIGTVLNLTSRTLSGKWTLPSAPVGWTLPTEPAVNLPPNSRRVSPIDLVLMGLAYNTDGVYPFNLRFDTTTLGSFAAPTRLAVAACPAMDNRPTIDGDLSDWPLGANNVAGDFLLVRGQRTGTDAGAADHPTLPTQAFFGIDRERMYVAVRCSLVAGELPVWRADNRVPLDGAIPWGQDVVEILIDPRGTSEGTSSDVYDLQIKPNGVLLARRGCLTEPPVGKSEPWESGAMVAVQVQRDGWVVELALPLASLGREAQENRLWGLNITRLDARRGEYSSWSGSRGMCYSPQALGNLIVLRP